VYSNGYWFLDLRRNGVWDGGVNDKLIAWGCLVPRPSGDWNGGRKDEDRCVQQRFWFLDYNGDYLWDGGW